MLQFALALDGLTDVEFPIDGVPIVVDPITCARVVISVGTRYTLSDKNNNRDVNKEVSHEITTIIYR
mgnify:CR=1 FL=1